MKKIIGLLVIATILGAGVLKAQNHKGGKCGQDKGEKMEERSNKAKTELGLNAEQSTKWDAVHEDYMKEMKALRDDTSISSDEKKEKKKALSKQKDEALQAFLSKDQMKQLKEMQKEMRDSKPGGKQGGQKWGQMKEELNLNDEQSKQWDEITSKNRSEMQSIKNDESMDEEAKKSKMKELKKEANSQIMAILDKDQQNLYKKKKDEMKKMRKQKSGQNGKGKIDMKE